jgi:beta-galactosidase/beta-glucuronidase
MVETKLTHPRPEYPRPQFRRRDWLSLNGEWEFAFDDDDVGIKHRWWDGQPLDMKIIVPFPYQSEASGINDKSIHEVVWYARQFEIPSHWSFENLIIHFGAVDYSATVWVNGKEVGHNRGGHVPFSFNIAPYLRESHNRLIVRVQDLQTHRQPRGKQSPSGRPARILYYCTTGIWQTVWIEPVPARRIEHLILGSSETLDAIDLAVYLNTHYASWQVEATVFSDLDSDRVVEQVSKTTLSAFSQIRLYIPEAKTWSPTEPHLYKLRVRLLNGGEVIDSVETYTGIRNIVLRDGQYVLNGEPIFLAMVMDQGYWPQGNLSAPSDEALRQDVEWVKRFGFNSVRKHQKIEDPRWLYWCDRLGVLVWAEMASAMRWSYEAEDSLLAEWERAVRRDLNHPSIITWVPLNESMGFRGVRRHHPGHYAFIERIVNVTRLLDTTRPVIDNDGWEHTDLTDVCTIHDYTPDLEKFKARYQGLMNGGDLPSYAWHRKEPTFLNGARYRGQPIVLSEVGGLLTIPENVSEKQRDRLYKNYSSYSTKEDFLRRFQNLMDILSEFKFLAGFSYTQLTDIEQEVNGLLTYNRQPKFDPEQVAQINRHLLDSMM